MLHLRGCIRSCFIYQSVYRQWSPAARPMEGCLHRNRCYQLKSLVTLHFCCPYCPPNNCCHKASLYPNSCAPFVCCLNPCHFFLSGALACGFAIYVNICRVFHIRCMYLYFVCLFICFIIFSSFSHLFWCSLSLCDSNCF